MMLLDQTPVRSPDFSIASAVVQSQHFIRIGRHARIVRQPLWSALAAKVVLALRQHNILRESTNP